MRGLAVFTLALLGTSSPSPQTQPPQPVLNTLPTGYFIALDAVPEIICVGPDGAVSGSGSYIESTYVLTAAHVVSGRQCMIDDKPIETIYLDGKNDLAVVKTSEPGTALMTISCARLKAGDEAFAVGYANGTDFVAQRLQAIGRTVPSKNASFGGEAIYRGRIFHGMSGGPVVDGNGSLVGIVNGGDESGILLSRSVADSYLCQDHK